MPYHFEKMADICVVVDNFGQHADKLDDALGSLVARSTFARQDAHAGHHTLALLGAHLLQKERTGKESSRLRVCQGLQSSHRQDVQSSILLQNGFRECQSPGQNSMSIRIPCRASLAFPGTHVHCMQVLTCAWMLSSAVCTWDHMACSLYQLVR